MTNDKPKIIPPVPSVLSIDELICEQLEAELENRESGIAERLEIKRSYHDDEDTL